MTITVKSDKRLEEGRGKCGGEGNQTDLAEVQVKSISEQGIKSWEKGLHRVIEEMADTDGQQDFEGGALGSAEARLSMKRGDVGLG